MSRTPPRVQRPEPEALGRHDFLPFGEELAPQTPPVDKKLFTGQERDFETGQDYFDYRQLRTDLGRFLAPDPISITPERLRGPQRFNQYAYAVNNPLRYVDPNGLDIITYDAEGNEIDRIKQSKWHNFWNGDSYQLETDNGIFSIADALTPLPDGETYTIVSAGETSQLLSDFLAAESPASSGQSLSYGEIAQRATGDWNWKASLNQQFGPNALFMLEGKGQRSDYLGNYAFGYLMNAWDPIGPNTWLAKWGGAAFNLYDSFRTGANAFKGSAFTGYDDPRDFAAIDAGAALYWRTR